MQGSWLAANWWQLVLAAVLLVGYIVQMAISERTTKELKSEFAKFRDDFAEHLNEPGLHRGPDFELRMLNMERQLENASRVLADIHNNVAKLLGRQN